MRHRREQVWTGAARQALTALLPVHCAGCGRADSVWCLTCHQQLAGPARPVAQLARAAPSGLLVPSWALTEYAGNAKSLILAWKEHRRADLGSPIAAGIASAAIALLDHEAVKVSCLLVVGVPSAKASVRARGGDLLAEVAVEVSRRLRARGVTARACSALRQQGGVRDQAGLDHDERAGNLAGQLRALGALGGRDVLIIDDIVTTGATAVEATRALSAAGAQVVGVAALAATVRRFPGRIYLDE